MAVVLGVLREKEDNTVSEPRDSDTAPPHALDKADITIRSQHLFSAKLRIPLNTILQAVLASGQSWAHALGGLVVCVGGWSASGVLWH